MTEPPELLDPRDARPSARESVRVWLALQRTLALRPQDARAGLVRGVSPERLAAVAAEPVPSRAWLDDAARILAGLGAVGVPFGSPRYPARLARLDDAAPLLWLRGDPAALAGRAVAIVGARAATRSGREFTRELAATLARARVVVVSGLARGIDAAAHRGALDAGGVTLAVLACGLERIYPPEHRRLADEICERGALLTELPPGTPPLPHHFPLRNRLISALAEAVVVVEARERSGSLVTARHAANQGVDVMAVPGAIAAPTSRGTNRLLRDGAQVVLEPADVLYALGLPLESSRSAPTAAVTPAQRAILSLLAQEPLTPDELGRRLGRSGPEIAVDLLRLELDGAIVNERDGRLAVVGEVREL